MGWLAIAGLANGGLMVSGSFGQLPIVLGILAVGYGIAAGFSAIFLWRFMESAIAALRSWMAICLLFMITFAYSFSSMFMGAEIGLAGFLLVTGILFFLLDRYVRGKFDVAP